MMIEKELPPELEVFYTIIIKSDKTTQCFQYYTGCIICSKHFCLPKNIQGESQLILQKLKPRYKIAS